MPRMTPAVKVLLFANGGVFLLQSLLYLVSPGTRDVFWDVFGLNTGWWGELYFPIWQLVTYAFVHFDTSHVFFNMLTLYFFGTMLEEIVGTRRFAVFYVAAFLVGGPLHLFAELTWGRGASAMGASGATMAVMIAMAVMRPKTMVIVLLFPVQLWILASFFAFVDFYRLATALRYPDDPGSNVAYMVHIGGICLGFLAVKKGWIWKDPIEAQARRQQVKVQQRSQDDDHRMDVLLAKIHREGMNALSKQEKEFLKRMSKR